MKYNICIVLFLLSLTKSDLILGQPCPCTVSAGNDKNLCEPGGDVTLNGSITGTPLSYEWTPAIGLNDPEVLSPIATVDQTITYTLTVKCLNNTNLVVNSNFNNGNTSFTSDYLYNPISVVNEGVYSVSNNPQSVHPGFQPCTDHTGGGQMMVVNGSGTPNQDVWCQTIAVTPNTDYAFETWVATLVAASPALLQFSINGQTIGPIFQAPGSPCNWEQFSATWNSGASTSATICIVNQNTSLGGNDFALDDISFKSICTIEDKVTVFVHPVKQSFVQATICQGQTYTLGGQTFQNEGSYDISLKTWKNCDSIITLDLFVIEVFASIDPPDKLDCILTEIFLYGDGSSDGPEITYKWTTVNGNIISDPKESNIQVNKAGSYTLTVTYNNGILTCTDSKTIIVETDYTKPVLTAGPDGLLTCADTVLVISGTVFSPFDQFKVNWTTPNGKITSKSDTLNPTIASPGIYILTVTNLLNGCTALDTTIIQKDPSLPLVVITGKTTITCKDGALWISGELSDKGPGFDFLWSTSNGSFSSSLDSLVVEINQAGVYNLLIVNNQTACKSAASYTVVENLNGPLIDAGPKDTLSCLFPSIVLNGSSNLKDSLINIIWSTQNGSILSGLNSLMPTIGSPGIYYFSVLDTLNGCTSIDSVQIALDENTPIVPTLADALLTCTTNKIVLNGTGSSSGLNFQYAWFTSNGNITGLVDSLISTCDAAGQYILTVVNLLNGCSISDTLEVVEDIVLPNVLAGIDDQLTCKKQTVLLDGSQSSSGSQYDYQWSSNPAGGIVSGANTSSPLINQSGIYYLTISNQLTGCLNVDSLEITLDTLAPTVNLPGNLLLSCKNSSLQINAQNTATGSFQYAWSSLSGQFLGGQQTLTPTVNKPGTYTLLTTNSTNGCTSEQNLIIGSNDEIPQVNAGADFSLTCFFPLFNAAGSLVYSGNDIQITWASSNKPVLSGGQTLTPQIGFPGSYTLTVIDTITGCSASDIVIVSIDTVAPNPIISLPNVITCLNTTSLISLTTFDPSWTFVWTTIDGNIVGSSIGNQLIVDKKGQYSLTITDPSNGCTSVKNTLILEDIQSPIVNAGPDKLLTCLQQTNVLTGTVQGNPINFSLEWYFNLQAITGSNTLNLTVNKPGNYLLRTTNISNGCVGEDSVIVTEISDKPNDMDIELIPPGCTVLGTAAVTNINGGIGPYTYSINGSIFQSVNIFQSLTSGNYTIAIMDANGCEYEKQLEIPVAPILTVELPVIITIEYNIGEQLFPELNIPVQNISSVSWNPTMGLSCSDCLNPIANPLEETLYSVFVTDVTGCTAKAYIKILALKDFDLYVPNAFSPNDDGVNDRWMIYGDPKIVSKIRRLQIFDRWGEGLFEASNFQVNDPNFAWDGVFRNRNLQNSVFVYYFEAEFVDGRTQIYKGDINLMR